MKEDESMTQVLDDSKLETYYERVDREHRELNGWYGDTMTPVQVRWNSLSGVTQARLQHAHDLETGKCKKNRFRGQCS